MKIAVGLLILAGFEILFCWMVLENPLARLLSSTLDRADRSSRERSYEDRRLLLAYERREGLLKKWERRLLYTGMAVRHRWLTPEIWILLNIVGSAVVYFGALFLGRSFGWAVTALAAAQAVRMLAEKRLMSRNYRAVNDSLVKFLDFLGNYSIAAGEVTGILNQVSKYMEEPLRTVLDQCYYEAQLSGDASLALLAMAEKIEHPRFKELVRNMEVCARYSADFKELVHSSKRAVREHIKTGQERKAMIAEALINMLILLGMSLAIFLILEQLIGVSVSSLLLGSLPGGIALGVIGLIFGAFYLQICNPDK